LNRRPARPPDYETENRALAALVQALADSPGTILQTLADKILEVFKADSAGISLLTKEDGGKRFYWPAIAGVWKPHIGGGTPRDFGPCGDVLDRNAALLFRHFERRYTYFLPVTPPVEECLLVPFYVEGKAVGTIWAITHDDRRKFDAEDLRQLGSLGRFASAAYQATEFLDALEQRGEALGQSHTELAQGMAELQKTTTEAENSRRAALNLMEDALQARQLVESLNLQLRAEIAERKQAEDTLRRAMEFDETVMSNMGEGLYTVDKQGLLTKMNPAAEKLLGWTLEALRGKKMHDVTHYKHPDGSPFPAEECASLRVLRDGKALKDFEDTFIRKDGRLFPVSYSSSPLRDRDGEIVGLVVVFQDITERNHAQEALRQNQAQLENRVAERTTELQRANTALRRHGGAKKARRALCSRRRWKAQSWPAASHTFNNILNIIQDMLYPARHEPRTRDWREPYCHQRDPPPRSSPRQRPDSGPESPSNWSVNVNGLVEGLITLITQTFPKTIEFCLRWRQIRRSRPIKIKLSRHC
jgi:PAS domain S-box-containing protein